jgi:hypothetical protein
MHPATLALHAALIRACQMALEGWKAWLRDRQKEATGQETG